MSLLWVSMAVLVGFLVPTQIGINGRLGVFLESPILAALVSFTVGATSLLFVTSALGIFSLAAGKWDGVPLVYFTGGLIGAFIVSASSFSRSTVRFNYLFEHCHS